MGHTVSRTPRAGQVGVGEARTLRSTAAFSPSRMALRTATKRIGSCRYAPCGSGG